MFVPFQVGINPKYFLRTPSIYPRLIQIVNLEFFFSKLSHFTQIVMASFNNVIPLYLNTVTSLKGNLNLKNFVSLLKLTRENVCKPLSEFTVCNILTERRNFISSVIIRKPWLWTLSTIWNFCLFFYSGMNCFLFP